MSNARTLSLAFALLPALAACADRTPAPAMADSDSPPVTIIRADGPGEWNSPPRLVEELRIGLLEGNDDYIFGYLSHIAVSSEGTIYVADGIGPRLRMYDETGSYVGQIGRSGEGPGEYRQINGLALTPSEEVAIFDTSLRRVTLFSAAGELLRTIDSTIGGNWTGKDFHVDPAGNFYVFGVRVNPNLEPEPGAEVSVDGPRGRREPIYVKLSPDGAVLDTVLPPRSTVSRQPSFLLLTPEGPFHPFTTELVYDFTPEGRFVSGYTGGSYAFDIGAPDRAVQRVERSYEPVRLGRAERAQWRALADHLSRNRRSASAGVEIPETKPAFRDLEVAEDGRIWVHRYAEATERPPRANRPADAPPTVLWRDVPTFDVFEADGRFLGSVITPPNTIFMVRRGDRLWGVERGTFDEGYIVRYRMELDG
jgi:hypothetical protein